MSSAGWRWRRFNEVATSWSHGTIEKCASLAQHDDLGGHFNSSCCNPFASNRLGEIFSEEISSTIGEFGLGSFVVVGVFHMAIPKAGEGVVNNLFVCRL